MKVSKHFRVDPDAYALAMAVAAREGSTLSAEVDAFVASVAARCTPEILAWYRREPAGVAPQPVAAVKAPSRSRKPGVVAADADCAHPKSRVHKGLCGNCGTFVG